MSEPQAASELSHEPENGENGTNGDAASVSKKAAKKEAAKQEKLRRRQEQESAAAAARAQSADSEDPLAGNYGDLPLIQLQSMRIADVKDWTEVGALTEALKDKKVQIRGRAQTIRAVGKNMAFIVVREKGFTVQCVATVQPEIVSRQMVKYVAGLSRESIIDIEGIVSVPGTPIISASQQVFDFCGFYDFCVEFDSGL